MLSSKSSIAASARSPSAPRDSMLMTIRASLTGPVISTRRVSMSAGSGAIRQSPDACGVATRSGSAPASHAD